ncbi:hypothetical protein N7488_005133 [Penicillium malachiteum]|nr:hypothetical protein N7488_005133 [Penicillium malachiteum]
MANASENQRRNFIDQIYWDDLTDTSKMMEPLRPDDGTPLSPKSFTVIQPKFRAKLNCGWFSQVNKSDTDVPDSKLQAVGFLGLVGLGRTKTVRNQI